MEPSGAETVLVVIVQNALMAGNVFDFDYEQLSFATRLTTAYAKELLPKRIAKKELLAV